MNSIELPRYKCYKEVQALKIKSVDILVSTNEAAPGGLLLLEGSEYPAISVDAAYLRKHQPVAGGYWVRYQDGYESFSPADAFEGGYTLIDDAATFGIGRAIEELWGGVRVTRDGWNGPDQYLELQVPDEHSKMTLPYIYIRTVQGDLVPWLASQTDLLALDWKMA